MHISMNDDPLKFSLSNFLAGESNDPLQAPASFTNWVRLGAWAATLYEPELLATADARTVINYGGKPRPVINLCSYNYLGLANHPEVLAAAHEALRTHGMGACGSPMLSGMTDLHRELERRDMGRREQQWLGKWRCRKQQRLGKRWDQQQRRRRQQFRQHVESAQFGR